MRKKHLFVINMIVSVVLLIGIMGFVMLNTYSNNKNNVIELSRMNADENAEKINQFLTRQSDVMLTVTQSVEYLRAELNASNAQTKAYLVNMAKEYEPLYELYAGDSFIGIYGVFDGEYIDSTWIAPEEFDPITRSWYQNALDSDGNICVSEPYHDAGDGDFIVTLSRKLSDGSVMGMDIDVNHIKNTIGSAMGLNLNINGNQNVSGFSFTMTKDGIVTMHMDAEEIANDYSNPESSMYQLYQNVIKGCSDYFEVELRGEKYGVFPCRLDNGWYYITVTSLEDLHRISIHFINVIIAGTISVLLFAMAYCVLANRANQQTEKLAAELAKALEEIQIDPLTKLYNRGAYDRRLDELNETLGTPADKSFAVVMMDINDLKYVNDHFGHQKGDLYILTCCNRMKEVFGKEIYRLGGDEFAVILTGEQFEQREHLCAQISACGIASMQLPIREDRVNIAIGMASHLKEVKESLGAIVNSADEAMYRNKEELKRVRKLNEIPLRVPDANGSGINKMREGERL